LFAAACQLGLESIVSKKLNAPYKSGLSKTWLKIKNPNQRLLRVLLLESWIAM
jgi:bifunctional non-homologous end joining protein LigD